MNWRVGRMRHHHNHTHIPRLAPESRLDLLVSPRGTAKFAGCWPLSDGTCLAAFGIGLCPGDGSGQYRLCANAIGPEELGAISSRHSLTAGEKRRDFIGKSFAIAAALFAIGRVVSLGGCLGHGHISAVCVRRAVHLAKPEEAQQSVWATAKHPWRQPLLHRASRCCRFWGWRNEKMVGKPNA